MTLHALLLSALLVFCFGLYGVLARRHLIGILIGIELMLNAASLNFIAFSRFVVGDPITAHVIVLFIIGLAAAEAAIALSIIYSVYRARRSADVDQLHELQG